MPKYDFVPLSGISPEIKGKAKMIQFLKVQYFSHRIDIYQVKRELEWLGIPRRIFDIVVPGWEWERDGRKRERASATARGRGGE